MKSILAGGAAVLALAAVWPESAWGQTRTFDVRAQSAVTAIPEFARQAGIQIIAPADALRAIITPRIQGPYEIRTALQRLIARTGLEVAADDGLTIMLRMRRPPPLPALTPIRRPDPPPAPKPGFGPI